MELVNGVEILGELPVIYLREFRVLVLADTHLGFEEEMAERGMYIPRFQLRRLLNVLDESLNLVNVREVVIAGDFKHKFDGLGRIERRELAEVLTYLNSRVDRVVVIRGNHDNYLPILKKKFSFELVEYYKLGRFLIIHGHKKVGLEMKDWDVLIMGHEHPSIVLKDPLGVIGKFPCFLLGRLVDGRELITLPAVGAYQTGSRVSLSRDTYLSPIIKDNAIIEDLRPIIVDEEGGVLELPPLKQLIDYI